MSIFLLTPFVLAFFLLLWFDSNAFVEYTDLFGIYRLSKHLKRYRSTRDQGSDLSYVDYLTQFYNNFFVRLVTCEICICTWLSVLANIVITILLLNFYKNINWIMVTIYSFALPYFTLFLYRLIRKLK